MYLYSENKSADQLFITGRGLVSLSKTLHLNCLVLVQPRKTSRYDGKTVDWGEASTQRKLFGPHFIGRRL